MTSDQYAGTIYRDMTEAASAVEFAAFLVNSEIGNRAANLPDALVNIEVAIEALKSAHRRITVEVSELS